MAAAMAAEFVAETMVAQAYSFGPITGLYVWAGDDPAVEATLTLVAKLLAYGALLLLACQWLREPVRSFGRAGFSPIALPVAFVPIIAGLTIFLSEIDNLLRAFLTEEAMASWDSNPGLERLVGSSWQGAALAVVIAPLTEEFLFRGVILRGLLGRWKPWAAIAVSAVLFAAMHLNRAQLPIALATGLVLGWVFVRTRSLGLCMIGHAIFNGWTFVPLDGLFEVRGFNLVPEEDAGAVFHPWWFDLIGVALFAGGCFSFSPAGAKGPVVAPAAARRAARAPATSARAASVGTAVARRRIQRTWRLSARHCRQDCTVHVRRTRSTRHVPRATRPRRVTRARDGTAREEGCGAGGARRSDRWLSPGAVCRQRA